MGFFPNIVVVCEFLWHDLKLAAFKAFGLAGMKDEDFPRVLNRFNGFNGSEGDGSAKTPTKKNRKALNEVKILKIQRSIEIW